MSVTLSGQSMVTVAEALSYLQDQGSPVDDQDLLKMHINGVTALLLQVTGRDRLVWVDDDEIAEYRTGDGTTSLYLKNAPIQKVTSVKLYPMESTGVTYTGPTEPALYNDYMHFDPVKGLLVLKVETFPETLSSVLVTYEAGFLAADREYLGLKMICLDALAAKWSRWKNQKHGITSETKGEQSITYSVDDFSKTTMKELRRYRRHLFA